MGHSTLLEIIGSTITGGILLLVILRLNMSTTETRQTYGYNYRNQSNLTTLVMLLEDDFSRIAYCGIPSNPLVNPANRALRIADTSTFRWRTDINNDGSVDSIEYSLGLVSDPPPTLNPNNRYLIKKIWMGGVLTQQKWNLGLTQFRFNFYRAGYRLDAPLKCPVDTPSVIGIMQLQITVESPEKPKMDFLGDTSAYQVFWKQVRVTSKNLSFR
jgi:hypothetical protein